MIEPTRQTLLVVDDEEGPRQSLRMVFRNDYQVHTAESGERALEFIRANPVHAAIVDIRMAGISGIEVLRQIKAHSPQTEVIMLTAYETLETARQAIRFGACDYLSKPFDLPTIRDAVSRAIRLRNISDNIASTFDRFRQLTDELQDANLREEMARTASEIYAGVLHDINNPLSVITGVVEMLEIQMTRSASLSGQSLEEARNKIAVINKQIGTCSAIITRYLKLIRTPNQIETQSTSVNLVLSDLVSLLKAHPAAKSSKLIVTQLERDLMACINCTELIQILLNLTVNAFQSTVGPQTVEIKATAHEKPVDTAALASNKDSVLLNESTFLNRSPLVSITVSDQGKGIDENVLHRVFEPYFTTKGSQGGTGLGLSIVARLVKNCRGLVHLQTRPGAGTAITLFIPANVPGVF
ncbi:response regulator [Opitutales bacterium ASA1]|uniref:hybrid sensor histidine kinase/response regulator n=1 Tax=Congregicoccus parvus TaxID=3081749 RepID=UPI002B29E007|nr:response regulator [Opitutales bacterium ASA1]